MTDPRPDLADRLLDAQVAWALAELTGERFAAVVTEDVDRVLEVAATLRLGDVVGHDDLVAVATRLARDVLTSPVVAGLTEPEALARCTARCWPRRRRSARSSTAPTSRRSWPAWWRCTTSATVCSTAWSRAPPRCS